MVPDLAAITGCAEAEMALSASKPADRPRVRNLVISTSLRLKLACFRWDCQSPGEVLFRAMMRVATLVKTAQPSQTHRGDGPQSSVPPMESPRSPSPKCLSWRSAIGHARSADPSREPD